MKPKVGDIVYVKGDCVLSSIEDNTILNWTSFKKCERFKVTNVLKKLITIQCESRFFTIYKSDIGNFISQEKYRVCRIKELDI